MPSAAFHNFDFCILIFDMIYKTNPIVTKQPHFQAKNAHSQNEPIFENEPNYEKRTHFRSPSPRT